MKQSSVMLDSRNRGIRVDTRSQVRQALYLLSKQAWIRDALQSGKRRVFVIKK